MTYVLTRESGDRPLYFVRLGLGIFWECDHSVERAKHFARRTAAAKVLQAAGKHKEGWRVVSHVEETA